MIKARLLLISLFFLGVGLLLVLKLASWQIIKRDELFTQARRQHVASALIPAKRGSILASDLSPLSMSEQAFLLWADPSKLSDVQKAATSLALIFSKDAESFKLEFERIRDLLSREAKWVPIKDKISNEERTRIEELGILGIGFDSSERRFYPEGTMAAHILGFVGKDESGQDKGYFGLEGFYDLALSGKPGSLQLEEDAAGLPILFGSSSEVPSTDGLTLVTHIDRTVQYISEKKLEEGLKTYGAKGGTVVIMRPDGAVLAIAARPTYDLRIFGETDPAIFKNPIVSVSFEPGSILKILVMSAALDSGAVILDTECDDCDGPIVVDKYLIRTWNDKYFPNSTMTDVIVHSDNVGMAFVGKKLGKETLFDYLDKFGIGKPSGIDLQEEANPGLRPRDSWSIVDLVTASFGQGVAVTPIQMVRVAAAIANEGILPVPQVVDKIRGFEFEKDIAPRFEGKVISSETASKIKNMMIEATEKGEAKWAKPKGFAIAGKTGTAQIPVAGHYDEEKTIASFIGFAPADNPKFVMLVTLQEPTSSPWGSETAAPLWFSIARELFPYFGIQPE